MRDRSLLATWLGVWGLALGCLALVDWLLYGTYLGLLARAP
jgi:hypothetical protein